MTKTGKPFYLKKKKKPQKKREIRVTGQEGGRGKMVFGSKTSSCGNE